MQKISGVYSPIKNKNLYKSNEIFSTRLNINRAKKILKWKPSYSLEKGLRNTIYKRRRTTQSQKPEEEYKETKDNNNENQKTYLAPSFFHSYLFNLAMGHQK